MTRCINHTSRYSPSRWPYRMPAGMRLALIEASSHYWNHLVVEYIVYKNDHTTLDLCSWAFSQNERISPGNSLKTLVASLHGHLSIARQC